MRFSNILSDSFGCVCILSRACKFETHPQFNVVELLCECVGGCVTCSEFMHQNALVDPGDHGHPELAAAHASRVQDTLTLLQLSNCADTVVGNELLRGVSGGEKKRVTVGEGLLTNARVLLLDEISTGLDASVTFDICKSLRTRAVQEGTTIVAALLQPTPETFGLFDEVVLLREGCVVYHGPRKEIASYLTGLGFQVPLAATQCGSTAVAELADFLSDFLFMPHRALPVGGVPAGQPVPPLTSLELQTAWKHSALYRAQMENVDAGPQAPSQVLQLTSDFVRAQYGRPYVQSACTHIGSLLRRQLLLLRRNSLFVAFRLIAAVLTSIIFGGIYYQKTLADGLPRFGLFLNVLIVMGFTNLSEIPMAVENKFTAYRHVANGAHPGFAYVLVQH
jgi:hypothetical protein